MSLPLPRLSLAAIALICVVSPALAVVPGYAWPTANTNPDTLERRIAPPPGFQRIGVPPDSWAAWLRSLPLKPAGAPVLLFSGEPKWRQDVHVAVIDIDVGTRDLQQCADAIMRLRGEWLFAPGGTGEIHFNDTDGK